MGEIEGSIRARGPSKILAGHWSAFFYPHHNSGTAHAGVRVQGQEDLVLGHLQVDTGSPSVHLFC